MCLSILCCCFGLLVSLVVCGFVLVCFCTLTCGGFGICFIVLCFSLVFVILVGILLVGCFCGCIVFGVACVVRSLWVGALL